MKEQLISFKTAKLAKEKGFNIPTNYAYATSEFNLFSARDSEDSDYDWNSRAGYSAPTQSLLQKWLREKKRIIILVTLHKKAKTFGWGIYDNRKPLELVCGGGQYNTYEEALEQGLFTGLSLLSEEQTK